MSKHSQATINAIVALNTPSARDEPMVYEVWEDGEITLTKGGDLFGQRNLHCISEGRPDCAIPVACMPYETYSGEHGRIRVMTHAEAEKAQQLIFSQA
jgi:hypothetical protein